jgi:hypothetical protein
MKRSRAKQGRHSYPLYQGTLYMSVDILVRFTDAQAAALKAERARTLVPTSAFIRRAVDAALNPPKEEQS